MKYLIKIAVALIVGIMLSASSLSVRAASASQRPLAVSDLPSWKVINQAGLSNDGQWFGYRISPIVGDTEVVIRQTQGDKVMRFPGGDFKSARRSDPAAGPATVTFSEDSNWVAFTLSPTKKEISLLKKQKKPIHNKVGLVNLGTGAKVEFDKVRSFAFSPGKASWLVLQQYAPDAPAAAPVAPMALAAAPAPDKPKGADLVLHELATGVELNLGNVSEFGFDKTGRWLVWTVDAQDRVGNGIVLRDMNTGVVTPLENDKAVYSRLTWTEKGDAIAVLKQTDDKKYKDKLCSIAAFTGFSGGRPQMTIYDPAQDSNFPAGMSISPNTPAKWTENLDALLFGIRRLTKADAPKNPADDKAQPDDEEKPDIVVWNWQDKRLPPQQQIEEAQDKNFSYSAIYRVKEKKFIRLADDTLRSITPAPKGQWAIGSDTREYERMSSLDGRDYEDLFVVDMQTGARKVVLKKARWGQKNGRGPGGDIFGPSPDGNKLVYYDDGDYYVYEMATGKATNITKAVPTSFINTADDHGVVKPPVPPVGWTKDGDAILLSDQWDVWKVPVAGGPAVNLTVNGKKEGIRYKHLRVDKDEKGIDLSVPNYFDSYGEYTKKSGIVRLDPDKPGLQVLLWDDAKFGELIKAKHAPTYVYSRQSYKEPDDYYVTDAGLGGAKRLTNIGAQLEPFQWMSGAIIVNYTSTKGDKLQGVLYLPANYERGKRYPTIVHIYEKLSQNIHIFSIPLASINFSKALFTSNGYAVLEPDITFKTHDPGMSAVGCVLPALQAAIATGVVDKTKVGLQGHSWGGYETAFLITQTDAFAAAVAGAPLTDMISMYGLVYKSTGGFNGAILESQQGRFLSGTFNDWDAYVRSSPVKFAANVKTPLVILNNDKDGAVDFSQGIEYFNTLRRLDKPVVMLEYPSESHDLVKPQNAMDYTFRMKEFFDHFLMGKPAPDWWEKGVPRLEMDEHLKRRAAEQKALKSANGAE